VILFKKLTMGRKYNQPRSLEFLSSFSRAEQRDPLESLLSFLFFFQRRLSAA